MGSVTAAAIQLPVTLVSEGVRCWSSFVHVASSKGWEVELASKKCIDAMYACFMPGGAGGV